MSDEVKNKKIDLRLTEELYEEITLVGWICGRKRSELLRMMIDYFVEHGVINFDGQNLAWAEILELAREKQVVAEVAFAEVCEEMGRRTVRQTEMEVPDELQGKLQNYADLYAKNAIQAFRKYVEEV